MIRDYILHRENLYCLFVLLDARHEPLANDLSFIQWLGENDIPLALVFTKSDKVGTQKRATILDSYKSTLGSTPSLLLHVGSTQRGERRTPQIH